MLRSAIFAKGMIVFLAFLACSLAEPLDFVLADNSSLISGEQLFGRSDNSSDDWVCGYDVNKNNAPYGCDIGETCVNITNITPANETDSPAHYVACCNPYTWLSPQEQKLTALVSSGYCDLLYPSPSSAYQDGWFASCYKPTVVTSIFTNVITFTTPYTSETSYTITDRYGPCSETGFPHCYGYTFPDAGPGYGIWACGTADSTVTLAAKSGLPLFTSSYSEASYTPPKTTTTTVQTPNTDIPIVIVTPGMASMPSQTAGAATTTNDGSIWQPMLGNTMLGLYLSLCLVLHVA